MPDTRQTFNLNERVQVRPAREGLIVRDPTRKNEALPYPEGREVKWSTWWQRRWDDASIEIGPFAQPVTNDAPPVQE